MSKVEALERELDGKVEDAMVTGLDREDGGLSFVAETDRGTVEGEMYKSGNGGYCVRADQ